MLPSMSDNTPIEASVDAGHDGDWFDLPLAIVDVETTGLDPENDRVIELGVVHMRGGQVEEVYSKLVDPERELPPEVVNITGIKPEDLEGAPTFAQVTEELQAALKGRIFVAYNLPFDRAFVRNEFLRQGVEWDPAQCIDPLVFIRELHRDQGSKRLEAVCTRLGIPLDAAHRASHDAEATGHVLYKLRDQLPSDVDDLILLQGQWAQKQENEMAGWRNRRGGAIGGGLGGAAMADRGNALGPAYIYSDDTDPIRAMFMHLPTSGGRR